MGSHRCNDQDKKYIFKNQDMPEYLDSTWRNSFCMDDPSLLNFKGSSLAETKAGLIFSVVIAIKCEGDESRTSLQFNPKNELNCADE